MYVHIARQPIFNAQKKLFAYELLFRQTLGLNLGELSGDRATTSLLSTTFLTEGIGKISDHKPCFINFTQNLLVKEIANFFPKNTVVVEILEDVLPTTEVIDACTKLSQLGYLIALDDFIYKKELLPLVELAHIIKIDYQLSVKEEIERTLYRLNRFKLKFLAEKVETIEEFEHARKLGFHYYQGYFFAKPEPLRMKEVSSVKANQLRLLAEINKPTTSLDNLEKIIAADVAIAYKLLRYINSAYYYLLQQVTSIRRAIVYLGEKEIRRFVNLVIISELAADKPSELVRISVIRGRFCELLGDSRGVLPDTSELFLLGLFSLIDAILDTPMPEMMAKLPFSDELKAALIFNRGPLSLYLQIAIAYEKGQAEDCFKLLRQLGADPEKVYDIYLQSIEFAAFIA